jgi:hypothetical protein
MLLPVLSFVPFVPIESHTFFKFVVDAHHEMYMLVIYAMSSAPSIKIRLEGTKARCGIGPCNNETMHRPPWSG